MTEIAAIYARVSTRQQVQAATISSQVAALQAYAEQQGYLVPATQQYLDQGVSGARLQRRGLDQLRDAVASGAVDVVLCAAPDRLARTLGLQLVLLDEFRRAGVALHFLNQPQLAQDSETQLLLQIQGAFAEYERTLIRERLQRGKLYRLRQGQVPARAPYGYRYQKRTAEAPPAWHVEPVAAAVVQQIFVWYAEQQWTLRQIQQQLNAQATPAPQGGRWAVSSVRYILTQSAYRGIAYAHREQQSAETIGEPRRRGHGRRRTPRRIPRPRDTWIEIPVPPLLAPALWDRAQERLRVNAQLSPRNTQRPYLLRGLVVCGVCGHILQARTVRGKLVYYGCRFGGKHRAVDVPQHTCSVRADRLEAAVWGALQELLRDPVQIEQAWQALHDAQQPPPAEVRAWEQRQTYLRRQEQRLVDAYQVGALSLEQLQTRQKRLQLELRGLETRLAQLSPTPQTALALDVFTQRITRALQSPDPETQQKVIRLLIFRIVVNDDQILIEHIIPTQGVCRLCSADSTRSMATPNGSSKAASSKLIPSNRTRFFSGTTIYPPNPERPDLFSHSRLEHNSTSPLRQLSHLPQKLVDSTATLSAAFTLVISGETSSTIPATSCPNGRHSVLALAL